MDNFERNLQQIINKFGVDSNVGIPDFVLAQIVNEMLEQAAQEFLNEHKLTKPWHCANTATHRYLRSKNG